jgi:hypothetical protein
MTSHFTRHGGRRRVGSAVCAGGISAGLLIAALGASPTSSATTGATSPRSAAAFAGAASVIETTARVETGSIAEVMTGEIAHSAHDHLLKKKPKPKSTSKAKAKPKATPQPAPAPGAQPYPIPAPGVGANYAGTTPSQHPIQRPSGDTTGNFRVVCSYSHMNYDDAIVYPGQPGAAHMHTYFGNLDANASSTGPSLLAKGNSTCDGGISNRSAYWVPSIIDGSGKPLVPEYNMIYYKSGYQGLGPNDIVSTLPLGLKMLAGDMKATAPQAAEWYDRPNNWTCNVDGGAWNVPGIPSCPAGAELVATVQFPQCWDGKRLDSPDHRSHVAYGKWGIGCPAGYPVGLPSISYNVHYIVPAEGTSKLRLSSDMYSGGPGGYSMHADLITAWDPAIANQWLANCVRQDADCNVGQITDTTKLMPALK